MRSVIFVLLIVLCLITLAIAGYAPDFLMDFLLWAGGIAFIVFGALLITSGRGNREASWPPRGANIDPNCPDKLLPDESVSRR